MQLATCRTQTSLPTALLTAHESDMDRLNSAANGMQGSFKGLGMEISISCVHQQIQTEG